MTFATFDGDYVGYITGNGKKPSDQSSFLQMQTFGAFDIGDKAHMKLLSVIFLAWALDHETEGSQ